MRGPLAAFNIDPKSFEYEQLGAYVLNMLPTLNFLVDAADEAAMQRPMRLSVAMPARGERPAAKTTTKRKRSANPAANTRKRAPKKS